MILLLFADVESEVAMFFSSFLTDKVCVIHLLRSIAALSGIFE